MSEVDRRRDYDEHRERRHRSRSRSKSKSKSASPRQRRDERERPREGHREVSHQKQQRRHERSRSLERSRDGKRDGMRSDRRHMRSRSRSRSPARGMRKRTRSRSRSSSSSSDGERRHRQKRDRHKRKRSRSKDRKEKKKHKKEKKKKSHDLGSQWGKYGIINESNMYEKEAEFRTWLVEERILNPEVLSKDQTKKEFAKFTEDFNTATLPHEKYYNIDSFERRMTALRNGETLPPMDDAYDANADLLAHSSKHKKVAAEKDTYLSKEHLQDLRKVQQERSQVGKMKLMGMDIKQSFGVRMDGNEFEG